MINLTLSTYNLLNDLPVSFTVSNVTGSAKISIIVGSSTTIYSTTLAAHNGVVTFYDFRGIVRAYMRSQLTPLIKLKVKSEVGSSSEDTGDVYLLYLEYPKYGVTAQQYLERSFLTTRTYMRIKRDATTQLQFFSTGSAQENAYAECVFEKNGVSSMGRVSIATSTSGTPAIHTIDASPATILSAAITQTVTTSGAKILSYRIWCGDRSVNYYVTDEPFEIAFKFRNAFLVEEMAYIYGKTVSKTEVDKKEAISNGKTVFYNQQVQRRHQVVTELLSLEEAEWMNEMLISGTVSTKVGSTDTTVCINEITAEVSDASNEHVKIKFTWFFDDDTKYVTPRTNPQIFSDEFVNTYS